MRLHSFLKVTIGTIFVAVYVTACAGDCDGAQEAPPPTPPPTEEFPSGGGGETAPPEVPVATLNTVYFDYDRSAIRDDQRGTLRANAAAIRDGSWQTVVIEGHCDERGSEEYNLALGERRANAVRQYLVDSGVPSGRIDTVSFGESRPAAAGHDESAWSRNRRADFRVVE